MYRIQLGRRNTCRETERGTTGRSSVAGCETRRRQHNGDRGLAWWSRVLVSRGGLARRSRVVVSRGGLTWWSRRKSQREEETTTMTMQRWQHNGGSGSTGDGGSGSTELALLEWPELAERRVAGICREKWRSSAREEERVFSFEP
ncbi:hypothetical protein DEO72_LG7g2510 [Vigna unguiculata]|uniref:Uncharacterized protein n=1 Tax=Vigna unguiculata TaxID=3917 RepID=A0A4D6MIF4_VIGUN|nr:hypothetical protein DEO72_LG7g2510 [Vigna unguiculata]